MKPIDLERDAPEGWFSQYDIEVLMGEVEKIPENGLYLEIGVYKGRSLWVARKVSKPSVEIWGIDELEEPNIEGTNYIKSNSHTAKWDKSVDLLFIDAGHSYEDCKGDIEKYVPFVKKGGVVLFHDCDETSPGVVKAVKESFGKVEYNPNSRCSMAKVQL